MIGRRGVSLVTVMVSVALLAVALTAATSAFFSASKLTRHTAYATMAGGFAEGIMERTIAQPYGSIRSTGVARNLPKLPQVSCSIDVSDRESGLKEITVGCSWVEGDTPHTVRYSTLKARGAAR